MASDYSPRQALLDLFAYLRRRGRAGLAGAVLLALLGLAAYLLLPRQYRAETTLRSYLLKSATTVNVLEKLKQAVRDDDSVAVAGALGLSRTQARQLKKLDVKQPKYIQPDDANEVYDVYVVADVTDPAMFDSLTLALPRYVSSSPLVDSLRRVRQQALNANEQALRRELRTLDSLRTLAAGVLRSGRNAEALGDLSSGAEVVVILKQLRDLQAERQTLRSTFVTAAFLPPSRPFYPRLLWFVLLPAVMGFGLGLVLAELWALWRQSASAA